MYVRLRQVRFPLALLLALAAALMALPLVSLAAPSDDVRQADASVTRAMAQAQQGDLAGAKATYDTFDSNWPSIEDDVRAADRTSYRAIETAMRGVTVAFTATPVDQTAVVNALDKLHDADNDFVTGQGGAALPDQAATTAPSDQAATLQTEMAQLQMAQSSLKSGDAAGALAAIRTFDTNWTTVEGAVKVKSPAAYTATENDMAQVEALLTSNPPRTDEALSVVSGMQARLQPIAAESTSYGIFDAFIILLREGLEALLVVGALLAFLQKSGAHDKRGWVLGGAGIGLVVSLGAAVLMQRVFSYAGAALGSEMVEGIMGLVAAVMLFYMSYWLHSKAQAGAWQKFVRQQSAAALASGSLFSLALIAFLAVFREGAEASVFYLGIAPSISLSDLLIGLGLGVLALAAITVAVLLVGVRLPMRPFFLASSLLIYYLGFKFLGTGLHALQVADILPATPAPVPTIDLVGLYPTWETALPQLVLLVIAAVVLLVAARHVDRGSQRPLTAQHA